MDIYIVVEDADQYEIIKKAFSNENAAYNYARKVYQSCVYEYDLCEDVEEPVED